MKPHIRIEQIWSDDDLLELRFDVCDGRSLFACDTYVSRTWPNETAKSLNVFREQIYGGILDLKAGEFGIEYANGAALVRLHFQAPGRLYLSAHQQTEFKEFKNSKVASEAKLFVQSEPALLDNFIVELIDMGNGSRNEALLECI